MGIFKLLRREKGKEEGQLRQSAIADARAQKIADFILGFQRRLAGRINRFFGRIGIKRTTYLLIGVAVLFWCYCGYVLLRAIIN